MKNILIGISASISAYKTYELIRKFKKNGFSIKTILTPNALNFVSPLVIETLSNEKVYCEQFSKRSDVEHIALCDWADVFLIAPIDANCISKFAQGIADNLLSSVFCAYLGLKKPIVLAPAMNEGMWNNPFIQKNCELLKTYNCTFSGPASGFLACKKEGIGRLEDIDIIYQTTLRELYQDKKNNDKKLIVTLGGTKEPIDTVRFISNSSSGLMGTALADCAYYLGFEVVAYSSIELNKPYEVINFKTAKDLLEKLSNEDYDYLIMAAAVGDFCAGDIKDKKISKEDMDETFCLQLQKNPDVIQSIAKNKKNNQKVIGFCLADDDLINCAKKKLKNKNLDYIVANDVKTALNETQNKVTIIDKSGRMIDIELNSKEKIASSILEVVCD